MVVVGSLASDYLNSPVGVPDPPVGLPDPPAGVPAPPAGVLLCWLTDLNRYLKQRE